jgi:hypothetical protein
MSGSILNSDFAKCRSRKISISPDLRDTLHTNAHSFSRFLTPAVAFGRSQSIGTVPCPSHEGRCTTARYRRGREAGALPEVDALGGGKRKKMFPRSKTEVSFSSSFFGMRPPPATQSFHRPGDILANLRARIAPCSLCGACLPAIPYILRNAVGNWGWSELSIG